MLYIHLHVHIQCICILLRVLDIVHVHRVCRYVFYKHSMLIRNIHHHTYFHVLSYNVCIMRIILKTVDFYRPISYTAAATLNVCIRKGISLCYHANNRTIGCSFGVMFVLCTYYMGVQTMQRTKRNAGVPTVLMTRQSLNDEELVGIFFLIYILTCNGW